MSLERSGLWTNKWLAAADEIVLLAERDNFACFRADQENSISQEALKAPQRALGH